MMCSLSSFVVFFKQQAAYEVRISDGSSDVCSSDLGRVEKAVAKQQQRLVPITPAADVIAQSADADEFGLTDGHGQAGAGEDDQYKSRAAANRLQSSGKIVRPSCRDRVGQYV